MSKYSQDTYLGDGLYASYDGYQICLSANVPTTDTIYLGEFTFDAFIKWAIKIGWLDNPDPESEEE